MAKSSGRPMGYVDPDFPNPMGPGDATIIIYGYTPSAALAGLGIALFVLASFAHSYQLYRYRTYYFIPMLIGTIFEIVGYIPRLLSSIKDPYRVIFFVLQYFFIVVAPVLFSAAIYSTLAVLMRRCPKDTWVLRPKVVLWGFIVADVICTIVQVAGAALVGVRYSHREDPTSANHILLAGLAAQVFTFFLFVAVLAALTARAKKQLQSMGLTGFMVAFIVATLAIYLRTVFRLAETAEGLMENLSSHEAFFGALEFAPIIIAVGVMIAWHPGRSLKRDGGETKG